MVIVRNKKTYQGPGIYIGRPSILGNPFPVSMGRDACIAAYDKYMREQYLSNPAYKAAIENIVFLSRQGDINLVCWCAPLACHGDAIAKFVAELGVLT